MLSHLLIATAIAQPTDVLLPPVEISAGVQGTVHLPRDPPDISRWLPLAGQVQFQGRAKWGGIAVSSTVGEDYSQHTLFDAVSDEEIDSVVARRVAIENRVAVWWGLRERSTDRGLRLRVGLEGLHSTIVGAADWQVSAFVLRDDVINSFHVGPQVDLGVFLPLAGDNESALDLRGRAGTLFSLFPPSAVQEFPDGALGTCVLGGIRCDRVGPRIAPLSAQATLLIKRFRLVGELGIPVQLSPFQPGVDLRVAIRPTARVSLGLALGG